jgi:hypothetical protein
MAAYPIQTFAGDFEIAASGSAIVGAREWLTISIEGLTFSITSIHDGKQGSITTETKSRNQILIKINTWQGGDLTFKFKVGTLRSLDLYLAVHLDVHDNYHIVTYTFTRQK